MTTVLGGVGQNPSALRASPLPTLRQSRRATLPRKGGGRAVSRAFAAPPITGLADLLHEP